jgi:hypothetical protein
MERVVRRSGSADVPRNRAEWSVLQFAESGSSGLQKGEDFASLVRWSGNASDSRAMDSRFCSRGHFR